MTDITPDGFAVPNGLGPTPKPACPDCDRILKPTGEQTTYGGQQLDAYVCPNCQRQFIKETTGPIPLQYED